MPLRVIVVGAGIAGLTAAVSLSQAGHEVNIYEKSTFKTEVGAALNLMPNGAIALSKIGFDFEKALVKKHQVLQTINGMDLTSLTRVDLTYIERDFGGHMQSVLRADLHAELLRLTKLGPNPASLHLGSPVKRAEAVSGSVELESGETLIADLIIAADGSHTVCRNEVLGFSQLPIESGNNAFRFLIPTAKIEDIDRLRDMVLQGAPGATIFADVNDKLKTRHLAWYDCHGGELQNFVGIYPASQHREEADNKAQLLQQFQHFHPRILEILNLAEDVKVWPLRYDNPLPKYSRGRMILIGDAAHTMLPFSGQGANLGIEEAAALGTFFAKVQSADVPGSVADLETTRKERVVMIKLLSRIRFGEENNAAYSRIEHDALKTENIPRCFKERLAFEWKYGVSGPCTA